MAFERLLQRARPGIPLLDGVVIRCRRQLLAVGRERDGADPARMAFESLL